jgi:hypothetical protein
MCKLTFCKLRNSGWCLGVAHKKVKFASRKAGRTAGAGARVPDWLRNSAAQLTAFIVIAQDDKTPITVHQIDHQ